MRLAAALLLATACAYAPEPAACAVDGDCTGGFCAGGECHPGTSAQCPTLQPHFSSINRDYLRVGCGVRGTATTTCHDATGAASGSALDLSGNAYAQLVGVAAVNPGARAPSRTYLRIAKGDPDSSLLYLKIASTAASDPEIGAGMPLPPHGAPGSTCASAVATIRDWIAAGAKDD